MAAVVLKQDHKLNGRKLHSHLVQTLPAYAWPWFLRIQVSGAASSVSMTLRNTQNGVMETPVGMMQVTCICVCSDRSGCDRDLQAAEDEAGPGGFQSGPHPGAAVFPGRLSEGLHHPDCDYVSRHRVWKDQIVDISRNI